MEGVVGMQSFLPPLRALQAFEAFGRLGSVGNAAQELGVTSGAISQQLKVLEDFLGVQMVVKDGRRATMTNVAKAYHEVISAGFDKFRSAQSIMSQQISGVDLKVSGLPTLLLKWLNPQLYGFQAAVRDVPIRLEATHREPDAQMLGEMFRLTYGAASRRFPHSRALYTDRCFPVCSPDFLAQNPQARTTSALAELPLIEIDWGPAYRSVPRWKDWFAHHGLHSVEFKPVAVHSLSSLALEAAASGRGVTLAQRSFAALDLELGRLVRLSSDALPMPEPYFVCWGNTTLDQPDARAFLNWLMSVARVMQ